jgi:hypothetical protein
MRLVPDPGTPDVPTPVADGGHSWLDTLAGLAANPAAWIVALGGLLALLLVSVLVWRHVRRSTLARIARAIAGPLVLAWEAQGVYQLARAIGIPAPPAVVGATVTAVVLIALGAQANEHHKKYGVLGPAMRLMWAVAIPMGLIVALSAHTAAEVPLRILLPILAGIVFVAPYLPDEPPGAERKRKLGGFRYTPRRIAVRMGMFEATDADIDQINRDRLIDQMTILEFKRRQGGPLSGRRAARLSRLSLTADDEVIAEVRQKVARAGWFKNDDPGNRPDNTAPAAPANTPAPAPGQMPGARPDNGPDNPPGRHPDTHPGNDMDTEPDIQPGTDPGNSRAMTRTPTRARKASPAQVKARKLKVDRPDITWAELAKRVGANERTVRRWFEQDDRAALADLTAAIHAPTRPPLASANGRTPHLTATPEGDRHDH